MQIGNVNRTVRAAGIRRLPAAAAAAAVIAAALTLAACGGSDRAGSGGAAADGATRLKQPTSATLVLDFLPNAVHAGIYRAAAAGYYKANNIDLKIIQPTSTADTLKLIDAGKADFGIADAIDVATQIDAGRGAQAIAAIVQRPLGGLITRRSDGIDRAAALRRYRRRLRRVGWLVGRAWVPDLDLQQPDRHGSDVCRRRRPRADWAGALCPCRVGRAAGDPVV